MFNIFADIGAFMLLPVYVMVVERVLQRNVTENAELYLVGFHTTFNILGVMAVLPVARHFAKLIERLVPERNHNPTRFLSPALKHKPDEALDMAARALNETAQELFASLRRRMQEPAPRYEVLGELETFSGWQKRIEDYLGDIGSRESQPLRVTRHVDALQASDHLVRLIERGSEEKLCGTMFDHPDVKEYARLVDDSLQMATEWLEQHGHEDVRDRLAAFSKTLTEQRRALRPQLLSRTAQASLDVEEADCLLETLHWLDRVAYHVWRFVYHLQRQQANGHGD